MKPFPYLKTRPKQTNNKTKPLTFFCLLPKSSSVSGKKFSLQQNILCWFWTKFIYICFIHVYPWGEPINDENSRLWTKCKGRMWWKQSQEEKALLACEFKRPSTQTCKALIIFNVFSTFSVRPSICRTEMSTLSYLGDFTLVSIKSFH